MGSSSKLMAWTKGELITAVKLNAENKGKNTRYYCETDWTQTSVNAAYHYMHQTTGRIMYLSTSGGSPANSEAHAIVYFRNAVGAVTTHNLWYGANTTNKTLERTVNMETFGHGPGWYSGRVWVNMMGGKGTINMYWGQDNCVRGKRLVYWDSPTSNGNRIQGTKLTAAILNTGMVGVI